MALTGATALREEDTRDFFFFLIGDKEGEGEAAAKVGEATGLTASRSVWDSPYLNDHSVEAEAVPETERKRPE